MPDYKKLKDEIKKQGNLPHHVAIIMDGNGRWAKKRGLPRIAGHREGVKSVHEIVEAAGELGVKVLTLYTFSKENWKRPAWEISALMRLLITTINKELRDLMKNNVKIVTIGHLEDLPLRTRSSVEKAIEMTKDNTGMILCLALSYSGRKEIVDAVKGIIHEIQHHAMDPNSIEEDTITKYLYTWHLPEPDLLIRTSGEFRVSNFLLWQLAYAEIYVTETLWPDFRRKNFYEAVKDYQNRERRFGMVSEQLPNR